VFIWRTAAKRELKLETQERLGRNDVAFRRFMNLGDILSTGQIVPELKAADRWQAIEELIGVLVDCGRVKPEHREAITAVVKKREASMSTGIGFGIGIPHASTDLITEVTAAFGRSISGINFDALDNQPVHLVNLFLVPQGQFQKHLHTLASIAKVLRNDDFHKVIMAAPDAAAMKLSIDDYSRSR
jgi:mannitol/fructose-specific phosphotransferase system IIA component (Ntr-type)